MKVKYKKVGKRALRLSKKRCLLQAMIFRPCASHNQLSITCTESLSQAHSNEHSCRTGRNDSPAPAAQQLPYIYKQKKKKRRWNTRLSLIQVSIQAELCAAINCRSCQICPTFGLRKMFQEGGEYLIRHYASDGNSST